MPFTPLSQVAASNCFNEVRLVATDMDGTLTTAGKFTPTLVQAMEKLANAGIQILIVTGRSAGWVSALVNYLPIWGAIAENGGIFYGNNLQLEMFLTPIADLKAHRRQLAEVFQKLKSKFPHLQESVDNQFRLTDWTFDINELSTNDISQIGNLCQKWGWGFTYSTVQCHIKLAQQDKATGLRQVLTQCFPNYFLAEVLTVGDSLNDESLFDSNQFPLSIGVANALDYADQLTHQPAYVTASPEGEGFWELAQVLLNSRTKHC